MNENLKKEQAVIEMENLSDKQKIETDQYKLQQDNLINSLNTIDNRFSSNYEELNQKIALLQKEKIEYQSIIEQLKAKNKELEDQLKKVLEDEAKKIEIGNKKLITFGNYKQGPNGEIKPIEWLVLERKEGEALLLSKDILDCKPYNNNRVETSWKECTLNKWLNNEFYREAFSKEEQENIIENIIETPANPEYKTDGGKDDYNYIFCLSIQEIEKYFGLQYIKDDDWWTTEKEGVMAICSEYTRKNTDIHYHSDNTGYWWTRSPGDDLSSAASVGTLGNLVDLVIHGLYVSYDCYGIRPALWVKTKN